MLSFPFFLQLCISILSTGNEKQMTNNLASLNFIVAQTTTFVPIEVYGHVGKTIPTALKAFFQPALPPFINMKYIQHMYII